MNTKIEKGDIIAFLYSGEKTRRDFWESDAFKVEGSGLDRGICPYKLLNIHIEYGQVEKIYPKKRWKGVVKWRLTEEGRRIAEAALGQLREMKTVEEKPREPKDRIAKRIETIQKIYNQVETKIEEEEILGIDLSDLDQITDKKESVKEEEEDVITETDIEIAIVEEADPEDIMEERKLTKKELKALKKEAKQRKKEKRK